MKITLSIQVLLEVIQTVMCYWRRKFILRLNFQTVALFLFRMFVVRYIFCKVCSQFRILAV